MDVVQSTCEYVALWLMVGIIIAANTIDDPQDRADTTEQLGNALLIFLVAGFALNILSQLYGAILELMDAVRFTLELRREALVEQVRFPTSTDAGARVLLRLKRCAGSRVVC